VTDPRIPAALRDEVPAPRGRDPLHHCIVVTAALLTWLLGPAVLVLLSVSAVAAYVRAWRGGRRRSDCFLGDVRLIVAYLTLIGAVAGVAVLR
jgi:hypothetical protein